MKDKMAPKWHMEDMCDMPIHKEKMSCKEECASGHAMPGHMHGKMMHGHKHGEMMHHEMHGEMMNDHEMMHHEMHGEMMHMMLAHAYVPWQVYTNAFCPGEALMKGTLFPELWGVYPIPE